MSAVTTLNSKNQMTLPKAVREDLELKPGDKIAFEKVDGKYVLVPKNRSALDLAGVLHDPDRPVLTTEEMDETIGKAIDQRYRRSF